MSECPEGTTAKAGECRLDDEEKFWTNLRMQAKIRDILDAASC